MTDSSLLPHSKIRLYTASPALVLVGFQPYIVLEASNKPRCGRCDMRPGFLGLHRFSLRLSFVDSLPAFSDDEALSRWLTCWSDEKM